MDRTKDLAFMVVHGNKTKALHSTPQSKDSPPLFSSSSVKLPALTDSNQLLSSQRPSPSLLYGSANSSSSSFKNLDSHRSGSPQSISHVWTQLNRSTFLKDEISKQFGNGSAEQAELHYVDDDPSKRSSLMEAIMNKRNKEIIAKRENFTKLMDDLNQQRQQLLHAKERIEDRRRNVMASSPAFSYAGHSNTDWSSRPSPLRRSETQHDERPVDLFIRQTEMGLPAQIAKYHRMRNEHVVEFNRTRRPYGGELGPQSFEAWQMEDYYLVRGLVEDEVDKFLDRYFRPNLGAEAERAAIEATHRDWEKHRRAINESEAVQLLMEEILLEETRAMFWEAGREFMDMTSYLQNKTDSYFMERAEDVAVGNERGRDPNEAAYTLVTRAFHGLVADRDKNRPDVWGHQQHLHLNGDVPEETPEEEEEEEEEAELLHFHDIVPLDLRQIEPKLGESRTSRRKKDKYLRYMRREVQYFKEFSATNLTMNIAKQCKGIYSARVSPNSQFIAIGTTHGDVVVYDFHFDPMRPVRAISNIQRKDDAIVDIVWSMDASQLITINQSGAMQVWSMTFSAGLLPYNPNGLDIRPDDAGILPEKLSQTMALDVSSSDFMFQKGPLAESGAQDRRKPLAPVIANFSPSLTLLGTQNTTFIALNNGDLLRCDMEKAFYGEEGNFKPSSMVLKPEVHTNEAACSEIGRNIPAQLFRRHKDIVILICFVDLLGDLITVDRKGYVFRWKYSKGNLASSNTNPSSKERQDLTSYDWYQPHLKYKLDMAKTMYTPVSNTQPSVVFTHRQNVSQEQLQRERAQAEKIIESLDLGDPWHQEFFPHKSIVTQVFAPREKIPDSGSTFHIVTRHALSEQLSTYLKRVYKPVKVPSTKFLCALQTPDGSAIMFMLLFPEYPPKEAHISIVLLDLHSMKLKNWRRDIDIDNAAMYQQLLEEDAVACDITRGFGTTGSQYLFVNIAGNLSAYSMNTGLKVLRTEDPKFPIDDGFDGLRLSSRGYTLAPSAQLATLSVNGRFYVLAYTDDPRTKKIMNPLQISVLELADENQENERQLMHKALEIWKQHPVLPPPEIRMDTVTTELADVQPIEVYVQSLLMDIVDYAVTQRAGGFLDNSATAAEDRLRHYERLLHQWQAKQGPSSKSPSRSRAPNSRLPAASSAASTPSHPSRRGHRL